MFDECVFVRPCVRACAFDVRVVFLCSSSRSDLRVSFWWFVFV